MSRRASRADNDELYQASFGAQFMSGMIQPLMVFFGNLQFVLIAVVGGLRISSGAISVGDMQAMIQYARQFSQPLTHAGVDVGHVPVGDRLAGARRRAARRARPVARPRRTRRCRRRSAAGSCSTTCTSRTRPTGR